MIEDLIEIAYAQGAVTYVGQAAGGVDEYELARVDSVASSVTVTVRADGKFAKATSIEGYLSLGQVVRACGLDYRHATSSARQYTH